MTSWSGIALFSIAVACVSCAPTESSPSPNGDGGADQAVDVVRDISPRDDPVPDTAEVDEGAPDFGDEDRRQEDDVEPDVLVFRNTRVGFQYVGSEGASHYVDDVVITGSSSAVLVDEGFEGGELPEGWLRQIRSAFFTWEVHLGPSEAHTGSYSAKVTWYENQDEWLITPVIEGAGPFTVTFWNRGAVDLADAATLHVHYTCTDGLEWHELYAFPGGNEDASYVWYSNTLSFDCR